MHVYLIDPDAQTVTEHETTDVALLDTMRRLTGASTLDQGRFTRKGDQAWVHDTGLIDGLTRFRLAGRAYPMAGKAVVVGCDNMGEAQSPSMTLAELEAMITW